MAAIQLMDRPAMVDQEEVRIAGLVRTWTYQKFAHAVNYLNFYARKVLPYTRWRTGGQNINEFDFVFPVDAPTMTDRYITIMVGVREGSTDEVSSLQAEATTTGDTDTVYVSSAAASTGPSDSSEAGVSYHLLTVKTTGGKLELITINSTAGLVLDGFGAWELPPKDGGAKVANSGLGGYQQAAASIASTVTGVVNPQAYSPTDDIDTAIENLQDAQRTAWQRNRRIIFNGGVGRPISTAGHMMLHTNSPDNADTWVSVPYGGIFIPPYAVPNGEQTYRTIRVAVFMKNSSGGTSQWRVETSRGNFGSDSIASDTSPQWRPMGLPFDVDVDGVQAEVSSAGEWITLGLYNESGNLPDPRIHQIIIWEDAPVIP